MRIAVGADHAGFPLKESLIAELQRLGHTALDLGTSSEDPVDYPDYAQAVGEALMRGEAERGRVPEAGSGPHEDRGGAEAATAGHAKGDARIVAKAIARAR